PTDLARNAHLTSPTCIARAHAHPHRAKIDAEHSDRQSASNQPEPHRLGSTLGYAELRPWARLDSIELGS
ncbi:MAG: hypothetical protein WAU39_06025, partial [Polyangiales bacterium]